MLFGDINKFYNDFLEINPLKSAEAVAWSSEKTQLIRFEKLFDIGVTPEDTLLDFGCGLGHMVDFLETKNYPTSNYLGVDINPNYILYATQMHPNVKFKNSDIFGITDNFDYIVASGVFTVLTPLEYMFSAINKSFELCNKGFAFNALNEEYFQFEEFNTFNPNALYDKIKTEYTNVKLVDGYLDNEDFTIYIYKS